MLHLIFIAFKIIIFILKKLELKDYAITRT